MAIKPLSNRVVAKIEQPQEKTASGLLLGTAKEAPAYAVVESVGPDVKTIKKGDKILYKEFATNKVKVDDIDYVIVEEKDILATI